jgi:outer membrane protein TolC
VGDITTVVQAQQLLSSAVQTEVQALQQFNIAIAQLNRYAAMLPEGVSPEVLLGESNE